MRPGQGHYLLAAIDRTSKFAFVELHEKATRGARPLTFSKSLIKTIPYNIHTVLTDNGTHFTIPGQNLERGRDQADDRAQELFRAHAFEYACALTDIDHRLTKPKHPWTNGQVERMNRTIKEATVKRFYHYNP